MLAWRALRGVVTPRYHNPGFPLQFDPRGELLLFYNPGARVRTTQTFLKIYAPINMTFVLYHSYLSFNEYFYPAVPGSYFSLGITGGLTALGLLVAVSVQRFSRKMVKSVALLEDGKHVRVTFLSAFSRNDRPTVIPIEKFRFPEETSTSYFRITVSDAGTLFINTTSNEVKEEECKALLPKVLQGYYINTFGNINLNKVHRKL